MGVFELFEMRIAEFVIYENAELVVLNKPAGLLSIPDREGKELSLKSLLKEKYGQIFVVHRLDRDTSGVIVFAKNEEAHKFLSQQFENRETEKIYTGLVLGSPAQKKGVIQEPLAEHPSKKGLMCIHRKGKESITDYTVLDSFGMYSWVQFRILTGRTHQIRVHMKYLGHPIACDDLYGDGKPVFLSGIKYRFKLSRDQEEEKPILSRLGLHSTRLSLADPSGRILSFEAPLPKDLRATLQQLQKNKKGR